MRCLEDRAVPTVQPTGASLSFPPPPLTSQVLKVACDRAGIETPAERSGSKRRRYLRHPHSKDRLDVTFRETGSQ